MKPEEIKDIKVGDRVEFTPLSDLQSKPRTVLGRVVDIRVDGPHILWDDHLTGHITKYNCFRFEKVAQEKSSIISASTKAMDRQIDDMELQILQENFQEGRD